MTMMLPNTSSITNYLAQEFRLLANLFESNFVEHLHINHYEKKQACVKICSAIVFVPFLKVVSYFRRKANQTKPELLQPLWNVAQLGKSRRVEEGSLCLIHKQHIFAN